MATTAGAIRTAMRDLITAIVPAVESRDRFIAFDQGEDFRTWAEKNKAAAFRRFSVRSLNDRGAPAVTNSRIEEVSETFEVIVAYPSGGRFGSHAYDLDDILASDQVQLHHVMHVANSPAGATVIRLSDEREDVGPVVFGVIRYRVDYYWSLT